METVDGSLDDHRPGSFDDDPGSSDPVAAIGAELEGLDDRPVVEHVAVLERVNAAIAAELAALDEV